MRICKSGNLPAVGTGMKIPDHECLIVPNDQNDSPLEVCVFMSIRIPCGVILCGPNPPQDCLFPQDRPFLASFGRLAGTMRYVSGTRRTERSRKEERMKRQAIQKVLTAAALAAMLGMAGGCGSGAGNAASTGNDTSVTEQEAGTENDTSVTEEENYETGDASLDDPRNADGIGERELLVVSFGTSYNDNRRLTVGAIEASMEEAFPDWSVRRGFTSQIIIDHVKERDGEVIDNVGEALDRAVDNGVKKLVIQPTHLMDGYEYNDLVEEAAQYADAFESLEIGKPLLSSDEDFAAVMEIITQETAEYDDGNTAVCFMGHGTEAASNGVYAKMQKMLSDAGYAHYYVGTVEASPSLEDVITAVKEGGYTRVVLEPLMIVAGDHANNDMAGDDADSWKSAFEAEGFEVVTLVRGLGEMEGIRQLLVAHAQEAVALAEAASGGTGRVASADDMVTPEDVVEEGMTPVYADELADGVYDVTVDSSSSMFQIVSARLTVADGSMTAVMTMSGTGYLYVYMGTAEEAAAAPETDYIPFEETAEGAHTYTVPVEALDQGISCAAFSRKKEMWYDRVLLFRADSVPAEAYLEGRGASVESLALADGKYTVDVSLAGGSGKASVESPAVLTVEDGKAYAVVIFSSPNYDYVKVDGVQYDTCNDELGLQGNSAFRIPVSAFDVNLPVKADTTAMSAPHEIDYTLHFASVSIRAAE